MNKEELFKQLPETLKEELHDVFKYIDMSKAVDNDGYSQIFRDIAHEEYFHAKHIKDIILDHGDSIPNIDEINILFVKAENMLKDS